MDELDVLSIDETAGLLRVKRWTIHQLLRDEKLRKIKIGRRTLIPRTSVRDLLARGEVAAKPQAA